MKLTYLCVAIATLANLDSALAQSIVLDDFEASSIRVINPDESDPSVRFLWNQYESDFYAGPDPGSENITTTEKKLGNRSLQINVTGGNILLQFYPATERWNFMHQYASGWQKNTYNAMRFWVKVPPQLRPNSGGRENVQLGTYVRAESDRDSQGTHYYHFYNFKHTGEWEQVIFDSHPTYRIGGGGSTEVGNVPTVGGSDWNYMDALTRFYFDGQGGLNGTPATFYFDHFELFTRPANENIDQVYSLHGGYVPSSNEIHVGWARRKDQDNLTYEVRYAFSDIHSTGWNSATPAPGGSIPSNGEGAYNLMEYSTTDIPVAGRSTVYIAIKPTTASTFRQLEIPIGAASPMPGPPTALTVQ